MSEPSDPIDPPPAAFAPPPAGDEGRLIDGRYRLAEVIGVGGMATVHRAYDTKLERPVAVKLLRREAVADPDIAMRFRREALAATVLRHPNIVACLETGTDNGQPFLVMEFIEGEDLAARLRRGGRLAPAEAQKIGLDVARALGVAHVRGIVHRDIKPGNILLARDGRAMVTDFGIARLAADTEGAVPGTTLGSVHYFSPEQAKGETTTPASDVYSLGLVLYEALTGQRAWSGDSTAELAAARIDAPPPSPRAVRPEIPAALDAVVVRALDPDPAKRYPNGNAMAEALEALGTLGTSPDPSSPTIATDTAALLAAAPPAPPLQPVAVSVQAVPRARARRAPAAIAGPLVLLLIVVAIVGGALAFVALPGGDGAAALASPTPRPTRTPPATARPSTRPTSTPRPTATVRPAPTVDPAATPEPTPTSQATPRPPGAAADLCEPVLGLSCGLDAGTYEPSVFTPPVRFVLGDGWDASFVSPDLIALGRDIGIVTIGRAATVYPKGEGSPTAAPKRVNDLVAALVKTPGVRAGDRVNQQVGGRPATIVDLAPSGQDRVALYATTDQTFYLETAGTTRVYVVDAPSGPVVITVEPFDGSTLQQILPVANQLIGSLRFR